MLLDLVDELPLEDQATLSVLTFFEVVQEYGIPPLPHKWEFSNTRGYTRERENFPLPYFDVYFHRNSGKPFIRDNAKLFSLHIDLLDVQGDATPNNLGLTFNYYLRNKVVATWSYNHESSLNYSLLRSFIFETFNREHQYSIVHGLAEVTRTALKLGVAYPRRLHLTACDYNLLRKRTSVNNLIMDTTLFLESVREISSVDSNPNLVNLHYVEDTGLGYSYPSEINFLTRPMSGSDSNSDLLFMELGSGYNRKHFKFNASAFRNLLESQSVLTPSADVEHTVELFEQLLSLLVSQDSFMTPDKVYSKEITYFLHSLEPHVAELNYILNFLNLNYIFFKDQTEVLDKVYCYFY